LIIYIAAQQRIGPDVATNTTLLTLKIKQQKAKILNMVAGTVSSHW